MSDIHQAVNLALQAHLGQVDKSGCAYILHPLRLMLKFKNETEMIVAVLHDVIEDSTTSLDDLKKFNFSDEVLLAVDCLSRRKNENYDEFIFRVSQNSLATKIKIEDLKDNLDLTRLNKIGDKDLTRIEKYHKALITLTKNH